MKTSFLKIALAVCAAGTAAPSYGQYAAPTAGYRPPVYSPAQQAGRGVPQFTASRPTTAAPAVPSFRPVNPPSQQTQRILVASRTQATAPGQPAAKVASLPAYQPSGDWVAPTASMGSNYGGGGYGAGGYGGGGAPAQAAGGDCGCNGGGAVSSGGDCGCAPACGMGCGGCCLAGHTCCIPFKNRNGDLVQHMPFFGTTHGYYYFRPYHVMHVFSQQELATRWGGDARNPYDNSMFEKVYQQLGVDARVAQPTINTYPSNYAPVNVNPQSMPAYPTPVPSYQPVPQMAPGMTIPPQPADEVVPGPVR